MDGHFCIRTVHHHISRPAGSTIPVRIGPLVVSSVCHTSNVRLVELRRYVNRIPLLNESGIIRWSESRDSSAQIVLVFDFSLHQPPEAPSLSPEPSIHRLNDLVIGKNARQGAARYNAAEYSRGNAGTLA